MALKDRTRRPTGAVPWPLLLVEGPEKVRQDVRRPVLVKSAQGRASGTGSTSAKDQPTSTAHTPGVDYEIVQHDGSWR